MVPTKVYAAVATAQQPYAGLPFEITVAQIEAQRLFSFQWHPFAIEPRVDYSGEPLTLVVFGRRGDRRSHADRNRIGLRPHPAQAAAKDFTANQQGWGMVVNLIAKYVAPPAQVESDSSAITRTVIYDA
jgi:hypothetical protein